MKIKEKFINLIEKIINKNKENAEQKPIKENGSLFIYDLHKVIDNYSNHYEDRQVEVIKKMLKNDNFYKNEKEDILLKMYLDVLKIHEALIPLISLNVVYSIDIVGGAVRDFLLNKEIKDLDILIEIDGKITLENRANSQYLNNFVLTKKFILDKNWCDESELEKVNFNDKEYYWEKVNKLIKICLNKNNDIKQYTLFNKSDRYITTEYGGDILKDLTGLIKLESKNFHFPIEILLTDRDKYSFYSNIDFSLCNVGMEIVKKRKDTQEMKLVKFPDLLNNCVCESKFIRDVSDKEISINQRAFRDIETSGSQLIYSFEKHLPRIEKKYPDFKLNTNYVTKEIKEKINTILLKKDLEETFATTNYNEVTKKPKKNKL